jgi:hypothetical protein
MGGTFRDFQETLLRSGKLLTATFQMSSVQIQEMYQPIGCREFNFAVFTRFLQIQKVGVLSTVAKNLII